MLIWRILVSIAGGVLTTAVILASTPPLWACAVIGTGIGALIVNVNTWIKEVHEARRLRRR